MSTVFLLQDKKLLKTKITQRYKFNFVQSEKKSSKMHLLIFLQAERFQKSYKFHFLQAKFNKSEFSYNLSPKILDDHKPEKLDSVKGIYENFKISKNMRLKEVW